MLSQYNNESRETPLRDAHTLLRFFELAEAARKGRAVAAAVFHELIATHATYWVLALGTDKGEKPSSALRSLAKWAEAFHAEHGRSDAQWGQTRLERFGRRTPDEPPRLDANNPAHTERWMAARRWLCVVPASLRRSASAPRDTATATRKGAGSQAADLSHAEPLPRRRL